MVKFTGENVDPIQNGNREKLHNWRTLTGRHLARDVVGTLSKCHHFYCEKNLFQ